MKLPKHCPVCGSTKLIKVSVPIRKNGFLIVAKCYGKRCNGEGYEWGTDEGKIDVS